MKNKAPLYVAIAIVGSVAFNINSITGNSKSSTATAASAPTITTVAKGCTKEAWICAAEKHEIKMRWSCEDLIKKGLKDPRSYQANQVRYWPSMEADPALVMIKINYNAKNSFGGSVRNSAVCHAAADGTIVGGRFL